MVFLDSPKHRVQTESLERARAKQNLTVCEKTRKRAIRWRSTIREFGLRGSAPAPTVILGNSIVSIMSFCHLHYILASKKNKRQEKSCC